MFQQDTLQLLTKKDTLSSETNKFGLKMSQTWKPLIRSLRQSPSIDITVFTSLVKN